MAPLSSRLASDDFDLSFKVFHELMARKVKAVLLVSSPYDAYIMEEEGRLAQRIIEEYRGLNLSRPPQLSWVSTAGEALELLERKQFDFVITMPRLDDMPAHELGQRIKDRHPRLPVFLLTHNASLLNLDPRCLDRTYIDRVFIWSGNADLLLALIKSAEDDMNVAFDTTRARVRVVILVEDSPVYYSSLLPLLYKVIVTQTQAVMEESLNEEHRFFRMRARPKILLASSYEGALALYRRFKPYLLAVLSDVRFPRGGRLDADAGFRLLQMIRGELPELPLLNLSSEEDNRARAESIPAVFITKNSPILHHEIRRFFQEQLGFGDFVFRRADGSEVARAANLHELEEVLPGLPDDVVLRHGQRNDFSTWLMARSEILLAARLKPVKVDDFADAGELKGYLVDCLRARRRGRQRGVVTDFDPERFDPEADFTKIGRGSLGGKARGLAFFANQLRQHRELADKYPGVTLGVPKTLVISTEAFDDFMEQNGLGDMSSRAQTDAAIRNVFLEGCLPDWLDRALGVFLGKSRYPLAVRSSSLLEDAQHQPFTGLYQTYLLANSHPDTGVRHRRLVRAVKLVFASIFLERARTYARSTGHRTEQEKMAVLIQRLTGQAHGDLFFPAISGRAHAFNFYPVGPMKAEDGMAILALGLGAGEEEGIRALRFCPRHPQLLPQFSGVEDILKTSQRFFQAIDLAAARQDAGDADPPLRRLEIDDLPERDHFRALLSTYTPGEHRIRDTLTVPGYPVVTFAGVLKHDRPPLAAIIGDLLELGRRGMGGPVEIEFAVNLPREPHAPAEFSLLQIRPMSQFERQEHITITEAEKRNAICYARLALGNGRYDRLEDIVLVDPRTFDPAHTLAIAAEVGRLNAELKNAGRRYLLVGPGRWGSSDRWLGIPVVWQDISAVGAVIETAAATLKAEASQGSHFFQNITSAGICYLTVLHEAHGTIDWDWFRGQTATARGPYVRHIRLAQALSVKVDGRPPEAVIPRPA